MDSTNDIENVIVDTVDNGILDSDSEWLELQKKRPTKLQTWIAGLSFLGIMLVIFLIMVVVSVDTPLFGYGDVTNYDYIVEAPVK